MDALKREGMALGKGNTKFAKQEGVNNNDLTELAKFMEDGVRLSTQTAARVRALESATFDFVVVLRTWWVVGVVKEMKKTYDDNVTAAANGKARRAIHKVTRCAYICTKILSRYNDKHKQDIDENSVELKNYILERKSKPALSMRDCKCFRLLDIYDQEKTKICAKFVPGSASMVVCDHLQRECCDGFSGKGMVGIAPRSKLEQRCLARLYSRGVINNPKVGAVDMET